MRRYIELTESQAIQVRGEYPQHHILMPFEYSGKWYLPISVLDNPAYEVALETLRQCEIVEVDFGGISE